MKSLLSRILIVAGLVLIGFIVAISIFAPIWSDSVFKLNMARTIERLGGRVYFSNECNEFGMPIENWTPKNKGAGALTLIERFGIDTVTFVDLNSSNFDDSAINQVLVFESIKGIRLPSRANDNTLKLLYSLHNLRILELDGTMVTEAGFSQLKERIPSVTTNRDFEGETFSDRVFDAAERLKK